MLCFLIKLCVYLAYFAYYNEQTSYQNNQININNLS